MWCKCKINVLISTWLSTLGTLGEKEFGVQTAETADAPSTGHGMYVH